MTVLMGVGVVPKNGSNPYVIMGADSKRIVLDLATGVQTVNNDYQKVFKIKNRLFGISGRFQDELLSSLLNKFEDESISIREMNVLLFETCEKNIRESKYDESKLTIFIASIEDGFPVIGYILMEKENIDRAFQATKAITEGVVDAISFSSENDLIQSFRFKMESQDEFEVVRKNLTNCLKLAAKRKPETCNQRIQIKSTDN